MRSPSAANAAFYGVALALALLLHAGALGLLLVNWDLELPRNVTQLRPYYIEATTVAVNPLAERQARQQAAEAARRQQRQAERLAAEAQLRERQAAWDQERQALEAANKRAEAARAAEEQTQKQAQMQAAAKADADKQAAEAEAEAEAEAQSEARRAEALAQAVAAEQGARQAITDDEEALAYAAQIQADIIQKWSRPPSARNGMQAVLGVTLIPTGEVVGVSLVETSGDDAFDRSALAAVSKAGRFAVPVDISQFERHFREFKLVFRPEDLRL